MLDVPLRALRRVRNHMTLRDAASRADAFLVSYPKSGRTWFRFILSNYLSAVAGDQDRVDLHNMFGIVPNFDLDPIRGVPAFETRGLSGRIPMILVSHKDYGGFLRGRPIILIVRDPRDVLVSAYFHATRHKHRFAGDVDAFLRDPDQGLAPLINYLNGWAEGMRPHRSLILSYEQLSRDADAVMASALSFLGLPLDTPALAMAIEGARFSKMRELEQADGLPGHDYDRSDSESLRMRKGQAGSFVEYLTPAQIDWIEAACREQFTPAAKRIVARTGWEIG